MERWHAMSQDKREEKLQKMRDYNKRCREARDKDGGDAPPSKEKKPPKPQKFEKVQSERLNVTPAPEPPPEHDPDKPQQILDAEEVKKYHKITEFMRKRSDFPEEQKQEKSAETTQESCDAKTPT